MKMAIGMTTTMALGYLIPGRVEKLERLATATANYLAYSYVIDILKFRNRIYIAAGLAFATGLAAVVHIREYKNAQNDELRVQHKQRAIVLATVAVISSLVAGFNFMFLKKVY